MDKITLEQILEPVGVANFFKNYWGKKHLVIRRNKFKDLFTWNDFNNCLNKGSSSGFTQFGHYSCVILINTPFICG